MAALEAEPATRGDLTQGESSGWYVSIQSRKLLSRLAGAAETWAAAAHRDSLKRRGPRLDRKRLHLSGWVAIQLAKAGVTPTTSPSGTFIRVLEVVQPAAGFKERPRQNLQRDAITVLKRPSIEEAIEEAADRLRRQPSSTT